MKKMFSLMSLLAVVSLILMACGAPATPHPLALTPVSTIAAPVDAHVTPTRPPAADAHTTPTPTPKYLEGAYYMLLITDVGDMNMDISLQRMLGRGDPWELVVYFGYPDHRVKALSDPIGRVLSTDRETATGHVQGFFPPPQVEVVSMDSGHPCVVELVRETETEVMYSVYCGQ